MTGQPGVTQQFSFLQTHGAGEAQLAARIRKGSRLLWERWHLIHDMEAGAKQDRLLTGWDRGVEKLQGLCDELAALDGRCVYEGAEAPTEVCLGCSVPNERWSKERCPAWRLEL